MLVSESSRLTIASKLSRKQTHSPNSPLKVGKEIEGSRCGCAYGERQCLNMTQVILNLSCYFVECCLEILVNLEVSFLIRRIPNEGFDSVLHGFHGPIQPLLKSGGRIQVTIRLIVSLKSCQARLNPTAFIHESTKFVGRRCHCRPESKIDKNSRFTRRLIGSRRVSPV